ncbi:hypothetical protein HDU76_001047 [Blyttiomyces sp. JEL0837]|nr:hypothetical protein HDU76_001047 [Blyttiomyces sp. JEL0837]
MTTTSGNLLTDFWSSVTSPISPPRQGPPHPTPSSTTLINPSGPTHDDDYAVYAEDLFPDDIWANIVYFASTNLKQYCQLSRISRRVWKKAWMAKSSAKLKADVIIRHHEMEMLRKSYQNHSHDHLAGGVNGLISGIGGIGNVIAGGSGASGGNAGAVGGKRSSTGTSSSAAARRSSQMLLPPSNGFGLGIGSSSSSSSYSSLSQSSSGTTLKSPTSSSRARPPHSIQIPSSPSSLYSPSSPYTPGPPSASTTTSIIAQQQHYLNLHRTTRPQSTLFSTTTTTIGNTLYDMMNKIVETFSEPVPVISSGMFGLRDATEIFVKVIQAGVISPPDYPDVLKFAVLHGNLAIVRILVLNLSFIAEPELVPIAAAWASKTGPERRKSASTGGVLGSQHQHQGQQQQPRRPASPVKSSSSSFGVFENLLSPVRQTFPSLPYQLVQQKSSSSIGSFNNNDEPPLPPTPTTTTSLFPPMPFPFPLEETQQIGGDDQDEPQQQHQNQPTPRDSREGVLLLLSSMVRSEATIDPDSFHKNIFANPLVEETIISMGISRGWFRRYMRDRFGVSLIFCASHEGLLPLVRHLCKKGVPIDSPSNHHNWTPLSISCVHGWDSVVKFLLEKGANPTRGDLISGSCAIHLACSFGNLDCVKALIDYGVPPDLPRVSIAGERVTSEADREIRELIRQMDIGGFSTAQQQQQRSNSYPNVNGNSSMDSSSLASASASAYLQHRDPPMTPLSEACWRNHPHIASYILSHVGPIASQTLLTPRSRSNKSLLYTTLGDLGNVAVGRVLVSNGAWNLELDNVFGGPTLNLNAALPERAGFTALHRAAQLGHLGSVELLLGLMKDGSAGGVDARDELGSTPLHTIVGRSRQLPKVDVMVLVTIVSLLIDAGADVNAVDGMGRTPIMLASNDEVLKVLEGAVEKCRGERRKSSVTGGKGLKRGSVAVPKNKSISEA